jgi:transcriptional regulator with XRE-family HTH domain
VESARQPAVSGFADALQRQRAAAGFSQRALARASGLTAAYVSLLEAGRRAPERATVARLADALDADAATRDALLLAAGYAPFAPAMVGQVAGALKEVERLIADAGLPVPDQAVVARLLHAYAAEVLDRVRAGQALTPYQPEPWPLRVLAVVQEAVEAAKGTAPSPGPSPAGRVRSP